MLEEFEAKYSKGLFGDRKLKKVEEEEKQALQNEMKALDKLTLRVKNTKDKIQALENGKLKGGNDINEVREQFGFTFVWKLDFAEVHKEKGGFDVMIGNPPYNAELTAQERVFFKGRYDSVSAGRQDTAAIFVELATRIGSNRSVTQFILPYRLMSRYRNHGQFQKWLLSNCSIRQLIYMGSDLEFTANDEFMVLLIQNSSDPHTVVEVMLKPSIEAINESGIRRIEQSVWQSIDAVNVNLVRFDQQLIRKIKDQSIQLSEICESKDGIVPFIREQLISSSRRDSRYVPFVGIAGSYVLEKYYLSHDKLYLCYDINEAKKFIKDVVELRKVQLRDRSIFTRRKILTAQNSAVLKGTIDENKLFVSNSLHSTYLLPEHEDDYTLEFILALINSKLMNFYHDSLRLKATDLHPQILVGNLKLLPIKPLFMDQQAPIVRLVNEILKITRGQDFRNDRAGQAKVASYIEQIDQNVYELFGLTESEISTIEDYHKSVEAE